MVFVAAHCVEAAVGRELHLVHEVVVHKMRALRVEQRRMDVDPHGWIRLPEIRGQLGVRHQMAPEELQVCVRFSLELPASMAAKLPGSSTQARNSGPMSLSADSAAARQLYSAIGAADFSPPNAHQPRHSRLMA